MLSLRATLAVLGTGGAVVSSGGAADPRDVAAELKRMRRTPAGLARPVVILSGYHTPQQVAWWARLQLCRLTSHNPSDFLTVSYPTETRIERAAEAAIERVHRRWRSEDADATVEVDAIGISMGGLVGRFAALPPAARAHPARATSPSGVRLRTARLFTFATPHQGSMRAARVAPDDAARDMKPGSAFLAKLNGHSREYPLVCYAHRGDNLIAVEAAAPPGERAAVAHGSRLMSHFTALHNPWFLVDLARRLRGEPPLLE